MIKNTNEIKRNYIRLRSNEQGLWLEVCEISWSGPYTLSISWTPVQRLGHTVEPNELPEFSIPIVDPVMKSESADWAVALQDIEKAVKQVLTNRRYFKICDNCRTLNASGYMHDEFCCQTCAQVIYGIVY